MIMSTISLDASAPATGTGDPAAAAAIPAGEAGGDFAQRLALAQAMLPAGQNLAAGGLPLQATPLGPTLEVLTVPVDQPDAQSLAEFAKAQGLDEEVVAWLFADPAAQAQAQAQAVAALGLAGQPAPTLLAGGTVLSDGAISHSPLTAVSLLTAQTGAPPSATPATAPGLQAAPAMTPASALASDPDLAAAAALLAAAGRQAPGGLGWTAGGSTPAPADPGTAPDLAAPAAIQLQSFAASLAAAAAGRAGPQAQAAAAGKPGSDTAAAAEVLSLEIDVEPGLESLWDPGADPLPPAGGDASAGAGRDAASQGLPDDGPQATLAARAQGYHALAERLGEAVAQRVLTQVEKGNWQVRLLLKPEKLGEVEIDLKMKAGQVDAVFQASNPVTRDLLNDGLPKLREVLNNAGMDIADLNVGTGRGQQAGGNPTPRQSPGQAASGAPAAAPAAVDNPAAVAAPAARPSANAGWDVLV